MSVSSRLQAIRDRAEKATPGPWVTEGDVVVRDNDDSDDRWITEAWEETGPHNAEFIAHARTDVPLLLAVVEAAEAWRQAEYDHGPGSAEPDEDAWYAAQEAFWVALAALGE
jgi:hypothetical protein